MFVSANILETGEMLAGSTGLEPAASGVTGRRSNQLNYDPEIELTGCRLTIRIDRVTRSIAIDQFHSSTSISDWAVQGSNLRQPACKAGALPLS